MFVTGNLGFVCELGFGGERRGEAGEGEAYEKASQCLGVFKKRGKIWGISKTPNSVIYISYPKLGDFMGF